MCIACIFINTETGSPNDHNFNKSKQNHLYNNQEREREQRRERKKRKKNSVCFWKKSFFCKFCMKTETNVSECAKERRVLGVLITNWHGLKWICVIVYCYYQHYLVCCYTLSSHRKRKRKRERVLLLLLFFCILRLSVSNGKCAVFISHLKHFYFYTASICFPLYLNLMM